MSNNFIIQILWITTFSGLIFIFPDFFAEKYQYLISHNYIFVLIFDFILLVMYLLIKYAHKIQQNIFVALALIVLGISTFLYSYIYGTKTPIYTIIGVKFAYMFYITYKVKDRLEQNT